MTTLFYIGENHMTGELRVVSEIVEIKTKTVRVAPRSENDHRAVLKIDQLGWYYSTSPEKAIQKYINGRLASIRSAEHKIEEAQKQIEKAKQL